MTPLQELLDFIKANPPADPGYWWGSQWSGELSKSLPGWEKIVSEQSNWPQIESVRCRVYRHNCYDELCGLLLKIAGLGLAIRWLDSHVEEQADRARQWIRNWENWSADLWARLNEQAKLNLIYTTFDSYPGEPFKTWNNVADFHTFFRDHPDSMRRKASLPAPLPLLPLMDYIPSAQIMRLRSMAQDSGDLRSVQIIDEWILQRERACNSASQQAQQLLAYTPNRDERELIARVMSIARVSSYKSAPLPQIFLSFEAPPIFVAYPELEENSEKQRDTREHSIPREERSRPETISIEEALGCYVPNPRIVLYARGLRWFASRNGLAEEMLRAVVLVHEIGHWVTHLLPKPGIPEWTLELYKLTEDDVHEGWAHLITWWVVEKVGGEIDRTFHELNKWQSAPYRVYEKFKARTRQSVMASLEALRQLRWPARVGDWERLCL